MYLDTCIIAKLYLPEADSAAIQQRVQAGGTLVCSELAIPEFTSVLARKRREGALTEAECTRVWQLFTGTVRESGLSLLPVSKAELEAAAALIHACRDTTPLRTLDAIHLATCQRFRAYPLFTTDRIMRQAAEHVGIPTQGDAR
jgi:predicted nucleic acid-binding protein